MLQERLAAEGKTASIEDLQPIEYQVQNRAWKMFESAKPSRSVFARMFSKNLLEG
jgi:hypothetical protein